ncbi:hypothetical protein YSA_02196 [Pseudomonas putida ND6]|uniref:Uncharacterized protein n=1 Tax=Pseudomonas putida ND6 TaxID=231023 RepID=I3UR34_PSEPU|nr:hypothetical protein YSA_02196 [Pseudomonas putida ND6]
MALRPNEVQGCNEYLMSDMKAILLYLFLGNRGISPGLPVPE